MSLRQELYIPRRVEAEIEASLADTRVVLVTGPRQAGKSTLVSRYVTEERPAITLDDIATLNLAKSDPAGFIRGLDCAVIDEIQRAPELMLAIKESVDRDQRPGRFLLTGSANLLALPKLGDSLAGRMAVINLLPLAQAELRGSAGNLIDRMFAGDRPVLSGEPIVGDELLDAVIAGGYPEAIKRKDPIRRKRWLRDYLRLVLDRDARDVSNIEQIDQLPAMMAMLAEQAGQLTNAAALGSSLNLSALTARRYIGILERVYLVRLTQPWNNNRFSRLTKTPKVHFLDTGLLTSLRNETAESFRADRSRLGALMECFAVSEVLKQLTWCQTDATLSHLRTKDGDEVDIVLEDSRGRIVAIEIKASATLRPGDFTAMKRLKEAMGDRFVRGLVLHDHDRITPVDDLIQAGPLSLLWQM
jgi:uncharacterized protein